MQAIEFVTKAHDGVVDLPCEFQDWNGKPVRVILLEETTESQSISPDTAANVWAKTASAWQGEHLVKEPQGEYEKRRELE